MSDSNGNKSIFMLAGTQVEISCPVNPSMGMGWFNNSASTITIDNVTLPMVRGFVSLNQQVGTVIKTETAKCAVYYKHLLPELNEIRFYAHTNQFVIISIIAVPIHDHSSVVMGGPAYGTFFEDDFTSTT